MRDEDRDPHVMLMFAFFAGPVFVGWYWGQKAAAWVVGIAALIPLVAFGAVWLWARLDGQQGPGAQMAAGDALLIPALFGSFTWLVTAAIGAGIGLLIRSWTHKTPKTAQKVF